MTIWRVLGVVVAVGAIFAAGCNDKKDDKKTPVSGTTVATSAAATGDSGSQSVTVQVDGDGDGFDAYMIAFFPDAITLHAGDTVRFKLADSGEPHTVTTGGPVDDLLKFILGFCGPEGLRAEKCGPNAQPPPDIEAQFNELFGKLPGLLPDGPGDANQTASNPCFVVTGAAPADGTACPKVDQPDFTGNEGFYNSGWMGEDEDFVVRLADDIAPGTYQFLCLLHGPEMIETITVVADAADADTAADVSARLDEQVKSVQDGLVNAQASLTSFAGSDEGGVHVDVLGGADAENAPAGVAEFGPGEISIPVGGTVTWNTAGFHTVSFNASEDMNTLRVVSADGSVHLNEPAGGPAGIPEGAPPSDDPEAPPVPLEGGTWNGEGFLSSGGFDGIFRLTFSTAGTYTYKCLIHPGMEGTVKVGG